MMKMNRRNFLRSAGAAAAALTIPGGLGAAGSTKRPNVVLVITDDQGYGDVGANGNKMIRTPNMNRLYSQSVRLTDFHVDPTCAPTRSALMSGRYSNRTGVWHTIMGRSLLDPGEVTLGEAFKANGYATAMFGKWHLGDNWPLRPENQGFDYTVRHGGGGVGQGPDWWGNDYFDDVYWRNSKPEQFKGYCTDVWFAEATKFIERNKARPFFVYLSTNAPHGPLIVDPKYAQPYLDKGVPENMAKFYGMIENIDENLGALRKRLGELGLADNTIFIFMTDNGTATGVARKATRGQWAGFNASMRGQKGSMYDGGHRVPLFLHWPAGKLDKGRDADQLCAHIDVQPTLIDLCNLKRPDGPASDGVSLKGMLYGDDDCLRDRTLFVHSQRIAHPVKWRQTSVMTQRWRLVNGKELYDIKADPSQKKDISAEHPDVMKTLSAAYDKWWDSLKPTFRQHVRIGLGSDKQNPTMLNSHDWLVEENRDTPWHQIHVKRGHLASAPWAVQVVRDGKYRVVLCRWPKHLKQAARCTHAKLKIGSVEVEKDIKLTDTIATFEVDLKAGPAMLQSWMTNEKGKIFGAYYVWVERLKD